MENAKSEFLENRCTTINTVFLTGLRVFHYAPPQYGKMRSPAITTYLLSYNDFQDVFRYVARPPHMVENAEFS